MKKHHTKNSGSSEIERALAIAARDYFAYLRGDQSQKLLDAFGRSLDSLLRLCRPSDHYKGWLQGMEDDVRQETMLLLLQKYLPDNRNLQAAIQAGEVSTFRRAFAQAVGGALKTIERKFSHRKKLEQKHHEALVYHFSDGSFNHEERRLAHMELLIQRAERSGALTARNAEILALILIRGHTRSEVAKTYGLSPSGLSRLISKASRKLQVQLPQMEFSY